MKRTPQFLATIAVTGLLLSACPGPPGKDDMAAQDLAGPPDLAGADASTGPDLKSAAVSVHGFTVPESAYWDSATSAWYVSNIVGDTTTKDGQGWISKVNAEGTAIAEEKWVMGLNAPKGIRVAAGKLYVADIDQLVVIDMGTKAKTTVAFTGAMFLNDVTVADDGYVYVSDSVGNAVWRYKSGMAPAIYKMDAALNVPNGLLADGQRILIVSTGPFDMPTNMAKIWTLATTGATLAALGTFQAKMDGIEKDGANFLISDNPTARIWQVSADGTTSTLVRDLKADGHMSAADIGFDPARRMVAVPDLVTNVVTFFRLQ